MSGLFSEAVQAVIGFMFGSRAVKSVMSPSMKMA
jgi:hypothetical protein